MTLESLLQGIGFFGIAAVVIGFVFRSLFKHYLDKNVESYKNQLSQTVELYKSKLEQDTFRATKLHEERGHVIRDLYANLFEMETAMRSFTSLFQAAGSPTSEEKGKRAAESVNTFRAFTGKNRIYFDKKTCELLDKIHATAKDAFIMADVFEIHNSESWRQDKKQQLEAWRKCSDAIVKILPELREKLETEFRTILGVPTD